ATKTHKKKGVPQGCQKDQQTPRPATEKSHERRPTRTTQKTARPLHAAAPRLPHGKMLVRSLPLRTLPNSQSRTAPSRRRKGSQHLRRCGVTYQTSTFYCKRCKQPTAHELSKDGDRARCIICTEKQRRIEFEEQHFSDTNRHLAALDGTGNRGPESAALTRRPH